MMSECSSGWVQTSAVYVLGTPTFPAVPPPSPPSPERLDNERDLCAPIEDLSLDSASPNSSSTSSTGIISHETAVPGSSSAPSSSASQLPPNAPSFERLLSSSPATAPVSAPDSPDLSPCHLSPSFSSCALDCLASAASPSSTTASPSARLAGAVHVLATEAAALQSVAQLYATSPSARIGFHQAVEVIVRTQTAHPPGKLVVVGVGKSGHIGRKLVATFNSLAISASFLHPTEALHGDLGHIRPHDALLFITYSGKTQELITLLPHVDPALPLIILTSHVTTKTCELVRERNGLAADIPAAGADVGPRSHIAASIILPAPIPVEEKVSFGVAAPTASTTTALAVGDALAIVAGKELHPSTESVFLRNHPGGAIGDAFRRTFSSVGLAQPHLQQHEETLRQRAVPWHAIPVVQAPAACADVLRAGYSSANGWVRVVSKAGSEHVEDKAYVASPSRIRALLSSDLPRSVLDIPGLLAGQSDLVAVAADTKVRQAVEILRTTAAAEGAVVAASHGGEVVGLLELQDLLKDSNV